MNFGLTPQKMRKLAYECAVAENKDYPKTWDKENLASVEWYHGFRHRNPVLSLRKPENTSAARIRALNAENINQFFENYRDVLKKYRFKSSQIYNFDETGLSTVVQSSKVLARRGQKQVGQFAAAERGSQITFGGFISAQGGFLPPVYVFPSKTLENERS